ncbi:hypothetical protein AA105894_1311 [Asaia spathodeae NBRC 105894]|nr:hypothetical protein AA105894_1311 [Asaia spathodeae NBRC 105894]
MQATLEQFALRLAQKFGDVDHPPRDNHHAPEKEKHDKKGGNSDNKYREYRLGNGQGLLLSFRYRDRIYQTPD